MRCAAWTRQRWTNGSGLPARKRCWGIFRSRRGRPFEHEARLRELLARQAELNAALDLDKGERQVAPEDGGEETAGVDAEGGAEAAPADLRCQRGTGGPPRAATRNRNRFDPAQAAATPPKPPSVPGTRF